MLPITTKDEIRFTPEDSEITYVIGVPSIAGRAAWQRALIADEMRYPADEELEEELKSAIRETMPQALQADLLDVANRYYENPKEAPDELHDAFTKLERQMRQRSLPFRSICLLKESYIELSILQAAKFFLKDVENSPIRFERKGGEVTDECFAALNEQHLQQVGLKALTYSKVSADTEKN